MSVPLPADQYRSHREALMLVLSLTALLSLLLVISGKIVAYKNARQQAELHVSYISSQLSSHFEPGSPLHEFPDQLLMDDSIFRGQIRLGEQIIASKPAKDVASGSPPEYISRLFGGVSDIAIDTVFENQLDGAVQLRVFAPFQFNFMIACLGLACILITGATAYRRKRQFSESLGDETQPASTLNYQYSLISPESRNESKDISRRELELAQESAVKANRFKSHLLSRTSHELLTPLNSIIGFNRLLQSKLEDLDDPQVQRYLDLVQHNAEHINTLVNDLVYFADRNKSRQSLQYESVDIHALIHSIFQSLENDAFKKGLTYTENSERLKKIKIHTDPVRLRQIAYNLIVNAIRYTDEGSVSLAAWLEKRGEKPVLNLSVTDTGRGIDKAAQQHIFASFVTSNDSVNNSVDEPGLGLGLGLTVVKDLTHLLGGNLKLDSKPGIGSCFTIQLPVHIDESAAAEFSANHPAEYISPVATPAKSLLVVDDTAANCYLIDQLLKDSCWNVYSAHNAADAIALAQTINFDSILLDIRMSPVDGYRLLGEIRKIAGYAKTPVVACTAHTSETEFNRLINSGFRHVLHKPVSPEQLISLLDEINGKPANQSFGRSTDRPAEFRSSPATNKQNDVAHAYFDEAIALKRAGNNSETAKNIYALLLKDLRQLHLNISSIDDQNFVYVLDVIHKIHGAAALSGTEVLREKASVAENCLKCNAGTNESKNAVEELFAYMDSFLEWADRTPSAALFDSLDK